MLTLHLVDDRQENRDVVPLDCRERRLVLVRIEQLDLELRASRYRRGQAEAKDLERIFEVRGFPQGRVQLSDGCRSRQHLIQLLTERQCAGSRDRQPGVLLPYTAHAAINRELALSCVDDPI